MKKEDLANRLAREQRVSRSEAADMLDRVIADLVTELKKGNPVKIPGLGTLTPQPASKPKAARKK